MKKYLKNLIVFILITAIFYSATTFILDSNTRCVFRNLYGIPCPGCGLSRAYTALYEHNITSAFYYHPLFLLPPVILLVVLLRKVRIISKIYTSNKFWIFIILLFSLVYIIRMILYFPNIEPMKFYPNGLFPKLIRFILNSF